MFDKSINGFLVRFSITSRVLFLILVCFILLTCGQDSIFYDISNEPEPRDPIIPGSPTNMVVIRNHVYVGNRMGSKIYSYSGFSGAAGWSTISLPQGSSLGDLATNGSDLYVLLFPGGEPTKLSAVRRYNLSSNSWDLNYTMADYSIQTLYSAGSRLFAGVQHNSDRQNFAITLLENNLNSMIFVRFGTSLLKGAAVSSAGNTYLATAGDGIFLLNETTLDVSPAAGTSEANCTGMMSVGGIIVAVTGDGNVYTNFSGGFTHIGTGANYTGAMCLWLDRKNQWRPSLLLLGTRGRGSSYSHGYREMVLNNGYPSNTIKTPGDGSPTSVTNKAKYEASLGTHPVESILQLPDASNGGPIHYNEFIGDPQWEPPIFASTSKNGLWSYRNGEWNAEE